MRRSLWAAFLGTTCLVAVPGRADAAEVAAFVKGVAAAMTTTGTVATAGATAGFTAGVTFGSSALGSFLVRTVVGIGINALARRLADRPEVPPSTVMGNFAQPVSYWQWVLGRRRVGGPIGFTGFATGRDVVTLTNGSMRHYSPVFAVHSCAGVHAHYIDEREVEIDPNGLVTTAPVAGYYRIRPFLGQPGQVADAELKDKFTGITDAHDFAGLTGAHIWAMRAPAHLVSQVYPTGRQGSYTPVLDGADTVYDPRSGTTGFTRNAALLIAHWAVEILGRGVDWDEVAAEADICDLSVTGWNDETHPKWQIGAILTADEDFEDQRARLALACDAWFYEHADGKVGFKVGHWRAPVVTVTDGDFLSLEYSSGQTGSGAPDSIAVRYTEPANNWREAVSAAYQITDGIKREEREVYAIPSHNQAWRVAARSGRAARPDWRVRGTLTMAGRRLRGHRFVRLVSAQMGLDMVVEVDRLTRSADRMSWQIEAHSVTEADFDPASYPEPEPPAFQSLEGAASAAPVPTGLRGDGDQGGAMVWTWAAQPADYAQELRHRLVGASTWTVVSITDGSATAALSGYSYGQQVEAQVRNTVTVGVDSDWSATVTETYASNATAPAALEFFDVETNGAGILVSYATPDDSNFWAFELLAGPVGSGIGSASVKKTVHADPDSGTPSAPETVGFTMSEMGLSSQNYDWFARPINGSGVAGTASGPVTAGQIIYPGP